MSLVVAERHEGKIWLAADSRLTHRWGGRANNFLRPELKLVILNARTCVGLAGSGYLGDEALLTLRRAPLQLDAESVADHLVRHQRASPGSAFLVAGLAPASLVRIRDGVIEPRHWGSAWIGDHRAYSEFQERREQVAAPTGQPLAAAVGDVLDATVRETKLDTIGEFVFRVLPTGPGFRYAAMAKSEPERSIVGPPDESGFSDLLVSPNAAFSYRVLPAIETGVGALGTYVEQSRSGTLVWPLRISEPRVYANVSRDEFIACVKAQFGLELQAF